MRVNNFEHVRCRFSIDGPSLSGDVTPVPLRTSSPRVGGGSQGGYLQRGVGGGDSEGESVTTLDSSQGRLHEGGEETIEFERFADWMRDLPPALHSVPLSHLCIPGESLELNHFLLTLHPRQVIGTEPLSRNSASQASHHFLYPN